MSLLNKFKFMSNNSPKLSETSSSSYYSSDSEEELNQAAKAVENHLFKTTNTKKRKPSCSPVQSIGLNKRDKMITLDPILIIIKDKAKIDRSDFIEFNKSIMSITNAEIKFTMMDKNQNLLIYPKNEKDISIIMKCDDLYPGCHKINLNQKDNRPKVVIVGLSHSLASKYFSKLKDHGIIDLIDLSKNHTLNIVKVVCNSSSSAEKLLESGEIIIDGSSFKVAKERSRIKISSNNSKNQANNSNESNKQSNKDNINDLINKQSTNIDDKLTGFLKKMEKNSIIQENRILEVIKVNNTNLVGSIVKNLNFYACAGKLNEAIVVVNNDIVI